MKTLYIDCQMGVAGDMLMAALLDISENAESVLDIINQSGLPGIHVTCEDVIKCGTKGKQAFVFLDGEDQSHRCLQDVLEVIDGLSLSDKIKQDAKGVYQIIATAEAVVHGHSIDEVHFHEVGSLDAITDVVGTCLLMNTLKIEEILASPIHVGSGTVRCAHGILPVPAPATAEILKEMAYYSGEIKGELCTPTGAALLKYFVDRFDTKPELQEDRNGRGMGTKEFPGVVNGLGVTLGYQMK